MISGLCQNNLCDQYGEIVDTSYCEQRCPQYQDRTAAIEDQSER